MLKAIDDKSQWDLIVIGGGATGLGTAVDAATRGYKTLLLEQADFSKGTSSRSTKLVHGGVRYLAQGDISMVLEALHERGLLRQNAPHLVKNQPFIIPNYDWWDGPFYTVGMKIYDMMAGNLGLGPSEHISKEETLAAIPNIKTEGLRGGVIYHDGQFDDSRLAIALAQTAYKNGATVLNYMRVTDLIKNREGLTKGVRVMDLESGNAYNIHAKGVINATGVFVDDILQMDHPQEKPTIKPSQGVHLVLDASFLQGRSAVMIPKTDDGRVLFAVPWHGKVIVGTTDTEMNHAELEPRATDQEIDFILNTAGRYLTRAPKRSDVLSVFAGLRPLPNASDRETKGISRTHQIKVSVSGLLTVVGGKWTTYRKMAQDIVDQAGWMAGLEERPCLTANMPLHGYVQHFDENDHLHVYGGDRLAILQLTEKHPELIERLHPDYPYIKAEVVWTTRHEMARTVEDVLARRLRMLFLDARAAILMAPTVAQLMAVELHKSNEWIASEINVFSDLAKGYLLKD
jgi:glycerol-3-phosphate dehydrogenase